MQLLTFRVRRQPERALDRVSRQHPRTRMVVWCNLQTDLVEAQGSGEAEVEALSSALRRDEGGRPLGPAGRPARTFVLACEQAPRRSLSLAVEQHGGLVLPPIVIEDGWETFRVALFDDDRVAGFVKVLREFGPHEVLQKKRFEEPFIQEEFMLSTAELLGSLTRKQAEALLAALHGGYYEVPRSATMVEIAKRRGLPRTTLEEHVRKAEAKVLTAVGPFLALRVHEGEHAPHRPRPSAARVASRRR